MHILRKVYRGWRPQMWAYNKLLLSFMLLFSLCSGSNFLGLARNFDSISYGSLNVKSGVSTILSTFPFVTFNAPQAAYCPSTNLYSFVGYDSTSFDSFLVSLNASDGTAMYNGSFTKPPLPFGLACETTQGNLYGQVWWPNGTAGLVTVNVKTLAMQSLEGFTFQPGTWWTYVASTFCDWNDTYYSLYVSPSSENLVGINVVNGQVILNVSLSLNTTEGVASTLQYNNVTNTFYTIGFNNGTQSYDLASINQATGSLTYLNIFTNNTLGDVTGSGLDFVNNILSIVYLDGYVTMLVNVDLKGNAIIGMTKLSNNSISTMLTLTNM
eukprot:Phypoly_transcript_11114.p1 GENE.Phypoly_transcript_11114~~Phypoly_transcript_11114.p1  ORF type:complete len:325 (+),score=25.95 Phypoly_transcript_11114:109-1083(+)